MPTYLCKSALNRSETFTTDRSLFGHLLVIYICINQSIHQSIYIPLSDYESVYLSIYLSIYLYLCKSALNCSKALPAHRRFLVDLLRDLYVSIDLFIYLHVYLYLTMHLSLYIYTSG